jgi:hypothetical protein
VQASNEGDFSDNRIWIERTTSSSSPLSDEIHIPLNLSHPPGTDPTINHAIADAGLFDVSVQTGWGKANAAATSQLWFSPLQDQTLALNIGIYARGRYGGGHPFTGGQISMLDLTSNVELWNYSWSYADYYGNIPWDSGNYGPNANFTTVETDFSAADRYQLTIEANSNAGDDSEEVDIQLTGLEVVPEPSSANVLLAALFVCSITRLRVRFCKPLTERSQKVVRAG